MQDTPPLIRRAVLTLVAGTTLVHATKALAALDEALARTGSEIFSTPPLTMNVISHGSFSAGRVYFTNSLPKRAVPDALR